MTIIEKEKLRIDEATNRSSKVAHVLSVLVERGTPSHATSLQKSKLELQSNEVIASYANQLRKAGLFPKETS